MRNNINPDGKDKIIGSRKSTAQRIWPHAGRPCHEIRGRIMLRTQLGTRQTIVKDGQGEPAPRPVQLRTDRHEEAMRQAEIYRKDILAGVLAEDGGEYRFRYEEEYLARKDAHPVSLTLPLQTEAFVSPVLFPFFDGLIPEGWLLDVAIRNTDISILDRMSLLLLCCKECIGAISVVPLPPKREEA